MNDILDILLEKQGVNLTADEIAARDAYALEQVRIRRNNLLDLTDKYTSSDFPLTDTQRNNVLSYRQALRDITSTAITLDWNTAIVDNVTWPSSEFVSEYDIIMSGINVVPIVEL